MRAVCLPTEFSAFKFANTFRPGNRISLTASPSFLVHHESNNTVVGNEIANITPDMDVFAPEIIQFIKGSPHQWNCANTQQLHTYTNTKYTYVFGCICSRDYSVHQRLPSNSGLYKHPTNTGDPLTKFKRVNKSKFENQNMARKQHSRK